MRLTETIRRAFVRAIMNDVPMTNYSEQSRSLIQKAAINDLPPAVRALYDNPATRYYLAQKNSHSGNYACSTVNVFQNVCWSPSISLDSELRKMKALDAEQKAKREELEIQLRAVAMSVNTRKALADDKVDACENDEEYLRNLLACGHDGFKEMADPELLQEIYEQGLQEQNDKVNEACERFERRFA